MSTTPGPSGRRGGRPTDSGPRPRTRTPYSSRFHARPSARRPVRPWGRLSDRFGDHPFVPTADHDLFAPPTVPRAARVGPVLVVEDDDFGREALSQILEADG